MQYRIYLFSLILLVIILTGYNSPVLGSTHLATSTPKSTATPTPAPIAPHFLLSSSPDTKVTLRRRDWIRSVPVSFGTLVQVGETLDLQQGTLTILCSDLTVEEIDKLGVNRVPCSSEPGIIEYNGAEYTVSRNVPTDVPYVIFPRNTLALTTTPIFAWNDTGASSYTVRLREGTKILFEKYVDNNSMPYPSDELPLKSNIVYDLWVQDNDTDKHSDQGNTVGSGFVVAEEKTINKIRENLTIIRNNEILDDLAQSFAVAVYLAGLHNISKYNIGPADSAWFLFEKVAKSRPSPAVHQWRGNMLARMSLANKAQLAYTSALELAQQTDDLESQALARIGLWCLATDDPVVRAAHAREIKRIRTILGYKDTNITTAFCEQTNIIKEQ